MCDVSNSREQSAGGCSLCRPSGSRGSESDWYKDQENKTSACCCLLIGPGGRELRGVTAIPLRETSRRSGPGCGQGAAGGAEPQ